MADQNLRSMFRSAESRRKEVELALDRNSSTYRQNLSSVIATYEDCLKLADRLSLFSPNETIEDIASGDLQYLLINFRLGDLFLWVADLDRKAVLEKARQAYERHLSLLDHYDLLQLADKKLYNTYAEDPSNFSTISAADPNARRNAKIANFKQEKELKRKLEFLAQNPAYIQNNEDAVRDLHLANLNLCTHNTFQSLETMNRELEVLAMAPPTPLTGPEVLERDYRERMGIHRGQDYSDRLDRPISEILGGGNAGPILGQNGKPLRPFTLLDSRQRLQEGVFRSGHNLPTMTIDEYLEEERRRGGIIEGGGEASGIIPEPDEDNYEKGEDETLKARSWDEYVEANPKGSGNTLNRG